MPPNFQPEKESTVGSQRDHVMLRWTLTVIGGKWRTLIICQLLSGTKRFGELRRSLPGITQRVLTLELRQLQTDGIVVRTMYPTIPPKVEYSLTERGRDLEAVFTAMGMWAKRANISQIEETVVQLPICKLRDEFLNAETFHALEETSIRGKGG